MAVSPATSTAVTNKYSNPLFLALIVAGLAGNYCKFEIFLNIDFLFGSIFAMLALQIFGFGRGVLAAAIIASYTHILWNHPYAIVILTAEVAVVGWLGSRRKIGLIQADVLFWLLVGMPLVYLFYHSSMHVPFSNTFIVMIKQAINGIANALVARLIFTGYVLHSRLSLTSYREIVYNLLAFFVLCPALIILVVGSRSDFHETDRRIRTTLLQDSQLVTDRLETWVLNRKSVILNLAEMAAARSPQQLQPYLELAKKSDLNYLRIGLLDRDATIVAYYPLLDELGQPNIGKNFADRPFIPTLKRTLKPMLSEVVMGRIGIPKPMVAMLVPVVRRGEYGGYVTGILSLEQVREHLNKSTDENAGFYTLIDKNSNVIMTNRADQKTMMPFGRGKGTLDHLEKGISQWVPTLSPNTPPTERWKKSFYVAESYIGNQAEWKLILEQPVAPFQKRLYDQYTGKLTLLFLILLVTLALAEFLSRKIVVTLGQLRTLTHELPVRLSTEGAGIKWPESSIKEANYLINNFREMANSLTAQFNEVRHFNESLEHRVEERTAEVARLANEQRIILNTMPIGACFLRERKIQQANLAFDKILGYEFGETLGMNTSEIYASRETYERIGNEGYATIANGGAESIDAEMKKKDGSLIVCSMVGQAVNASKPDDGSIWMIQDITERKRSDEDRLRLEKQLLHVQKLESLGVLAGGIAHDFNNILTSIIGNADLALMKLSPDSPVFDNLQRIEKSGARAADLAKLMLAYSGKGRFVIEVMDLNRLLEEMLHMLKESISKQAEMQLKLTRPLPNVEADVAQMRQLVMSLVINASEAIGDNRGVITITTGCLECDRNNLKDVWLDENLSEGLYAFLEVADTGCGMDQETLTKIFDPFFTTKFTGRGLGMAAVLGIVRGHKGTIKVSSELGKGSCIKVLLPAFDRQTEASADTRQVEGWSGSGTVLLVDDEETVREIGSEMLRALGFQVVTADDGRHALEIFTSRDDIAFVILDLTMPHMDGEQCFRELKLLKDDVKVIMSSGYSEQEVTQKFTGKGLAGFVQKPYNLSTLEEALKVV